MWFEESGSRTGLSACLRSAVFHLCLAADPVSELAFALLGPVVTEVVHETQSLAGFDNSNLSSLAAPSATGQNRNSRGDAGGPGAAGDLQRTGWAEKAGHVRRLRAEILIESGGGGLRQLANFAVLPERGRSAEGAGLRR